MSKVPNAPAPLPIQFDGGPVLNFLMKFFSDARVQQFAFAIIFGLAEHSIKNPNAQAEWLPILRDLHDTLSEVNFPDDTPAK